MQGQTECLSECETVRNAWEYRYLTDSLVPLRNPVGESISYDLTEGFPYRDGEYRLWLTSNVTAPSTYGYTNLVPSFCRAYGQHVKREIVAAHIAKGSTRIGEWLPGTKGYEVLREKGKGAVAAAMKLGAVRRILFVWLQGESDALSSMAKDDYKASLVSLQTALHRDVGVETFGMIRVGRFAGDARDDAILDAQTEICAERDDFLMLTDRAVELEQQPEMMNPNARGHFSAKGLETLGKWAGDTFGNYAK